MSKPERLLYSKAEAADMLGVSPKTLLAEVRRGEIRYRLGILNSPPMIFTSSAQLRTGAVL